MNVLSAAVVIGAVRVDLDKIRFICPDKSGIGPVKQKIIYIYSVKL